MRLCRADFSIISIQTEGHRGKEDNPSAHGQSETRFKGRGVAENSTKARVDSRVCVYVCMCVSVAVWFTMSVLTEFQNFLSKVRKVAIVALPELQRDLLV